MPINARALCTTLACGLLLACATPIAQAARLALVIGNDNYEQVSKLRNARADAQTMADALRAVGYDVDLKTDRSQREMLDDVRALRQRIRGGDEVVFFFSGHGVQLGASNHLLPVNVRSQSEDQVRDDALELSRVLADLRSARPAFTLAIVDACRDNPFTTAGRAIGGRGLTGVAGASGQMVIYAAGEGQQALDRLGNADTVRNGLFTRVFARQMRQPGLPVHQVLRNVRGEVARLARSVGHEQVPAIYDQVEGDFYFAPPSAAALVNGPPAGPPTDAQGQGNGSVPVITVQPAPIVAELGQSARFTVTASGSGPLNYQWYRDAVAISGATAPTFETGPVGRADIGAVFTVRVTGLGGTASSTGAVLTVRAAPDVVNKQSIRLSASDTGFVLAVRADGTVVQWGTGMEGGNPSPLNGSLARAVLGVPNAAGVSTTGGHSNRSLVVTRDGFLYGWGRNWRGSLGVAYAGDDNLIVNAPVKIAQVSAVSQALSCSSGASTTFALRSDGSVWMVPGERSRQGVVSATRVNGLPDIDSLVLAAAAGPDCSLLAIGRDGSVWRAHARQSGFDSALQRYTLVTMVERDSLAPPQVSQLSCTDVTFDPSRVHCLAVTVGGQLWSWGYNGQGQLGLGDRASRTAATALPGLSGVKRVLAVLGHSYALTTNGDLHVWGGYNGDPMVGGRTGQANTEQSDFWRPGLVPSIRGLDDIAGAPHGGFVTALKRDGTVWSWGQNKGGAFGNGLSGDHSSMPVQAQGVSLR